MKHGASLHCGVGLFKSMWCATQWKHCSFCSFIGSHSLNKAALKEWLLHSQVNTFWLCYYTFTPPRRGSIISFDIFRDILTSHFELRLISLIPVVHRVVISYSNMEMFCIITLQFLQLLITWIPNFFVSLHLLHSISVVSTLLGKKTNAFTCPYR